MKFHKQLYSHDPENGQFGDCLRTCYACLLDFPDVEQVPNFGVHYGDIKAFNNAKDNWLLGWGYKEISFPITGEVTLDWLLECMTSWNPDTTYMLTGLGARGVNHVVIARNREIIHDPHPSNAGLVGPCSEPDQQPIWWVHFLAPLDMHLK
ncbi:hypothetical protein [Methylophilus sp. Leaf414]|uniref:hypothetical protein n=1 Tax=Methylophilus sp. Leaf414 TaxID=1736371 RepID=UPI0006FD8831|nr:hypothetical protein [Methylophilus sp. Leaf414]KQT37692.1 hypothetical protein ASG24_01465 [Methylophilus sp. Leaf414]